MLLDLNITQFTNEEETSYQFFGNCFTGNFRSDRQSNKEGQNEKDDDVGLGREERGHGGIISLQKQYYPRNGKRNLDE